MDMVVLSHLRWDFVFQRPQHLVSHAARHHRALFVEEPVKGDAFGLEQRQLTSNLRVVRPTVPAATSLATSEAWLSRAIRQLVDGWRRDEVLVWHYSVMAEPLSRELDAAVTVFDCMDELSAFRGAPPHLIDRERALLDRADLVFAGGYSLWEAKRRLHPRVHLFPSSVDVGHFSAARREQPEPRILRGVRHPRFVYAGVIDERLDLGLLANLAAADIGEVVLVGPVVKIDPDDVPISPHVHQLGIQPYELLPALFAHCDVALMPFELNAATRFISPTKTPEYLAAGLPIVSTPIADVVRAYGDLDMVHIADGALDFIAACSNMLSRSRPLTEADARIAGQSWDATWEAMERLIADVVAQTEAA